MLYLIIWKLPLFLMIVLLFNIRVLNWLWLCFKIHYFMIWLYYLILWLLFLEIYRTWDFFYLMILLNIILWLFFYNRLFDWFNFFNWIIFSFYFWNIMMDWLTNCNTSQNLFLILEHFIKKRLMIWNRNLCLFTHKILNTFLTHLRSTFKSLNCHIMWVHISNNKICLF